MSDWRKRAACFGMPTEWWYPDSLGRPAFTPSENTTRAREICAGCPVKDECREWAVAHNEAGIWGDSDERERRYVVPPDEPPVMPPHTCGTYGGYTKILRHNKTFGTNLVCSPCNEANNERGRKIAARMGAEVRERRNLKERERRIQAEAEGKIRAKKGRDWTYGGIYS